MKPFLMQIAAIIRVACTAIVLGCLLYAPAGATTPYTIYDNGNPVIATGYNTSLHWIANEFRFESPGSLQALRLYLIYESPSNLTDVVWEVYTDDEGKPGKLLSGASGAGTRTLLGSVGTLSTYQVDLTLPEILHLDPGRYWLTVHTLGDSYIYWSDSSRDGTPRKLALDYGSMPWQQMGTGSAFQLIGVVPEPGHATLLVLGLGALYVLRRRDATKTAHYASSVTGADRGVTGGRSEV